MPPGANILQLIMQLLAGAGMKNVTSGVKDLSESGTDLQTLVGMPGFLPMMAGAGVKDVANSMSLIQPLMKLLTPPQPPPPPDPKEVGAAMTMLSAKLAPGMGGLMLPPAPSMGAPGMSQSGY